MSYLTLTLTLLMWVFLPPLSRPRGQQEPLLWRLPRPLGSLWDRGEERGRSDQESRKLQVLHLRPRLLAAAHVPLRLHLQGHSWSAWAGKGGRGGNTPFLSVSIKIYGSFFSCSNFKKSLFVSSQMSPLSSRRRRKMRFCIFKLLTVGVWRTISCLVKVLYLRNRKKIFSLDK